MLAYVAPLWLVGVVCLAASIVGKAVKLGSAEIPAIPSPVARLALALVGVLALALGLVLLRQGSQTSPSPTPTLPSSPTPPPSVPSSPTPPPSTAERVWWHGTLTLSGEEGVTGWFLDPVPPARAPQGDLGLNCGLSCNPNELAGNAIVAWDSPSPPKQQQCADLLNTRLGQRRLDVQAGSMACFRTTDDRVGYVKVATMQDHRRMNLEVTVWQRQ